jgi:hypothetical protein
MRGELTMKVTKATKATKVIEELRARLRDRAVRAVCRKERHR